MAIDRLGPVDPVAKYNRTEKAAKVERKESLDSVDVSQEALRQAAIRQVAEAVRQTPDVRMDRVEEVKAKLQDPNYINDLVVGRVADRLMEDVFEI